MGEWGGTVVVVAVLMMASILATIASRMRWAALRRAQRLTEQLHVASTTDGLTGCLNAQAFHDRVAGLLGGDEFAVALPGAGDDVARRVANEVRTAMAVHGGPTVSIGIALATAGTTATSDSLYRTADRALYDAKQAGRDNVITAV